jgi:endonuclease VIII
LMRASVEGTRPLRRVYRRAGRGCPRCGAVIRSAPQGDNARTAYWCPRCQVGGDPPAS